MTFLKYFLYTISSSVAFVIISWLVMVAFFPTTNTEDATGVLLISMLVGALSGVTILTFRKKSNE